jgi:hypothetical protein
MQRKEPGTRRRQMISQPPRPWTFLHAAVAVGRRRGQRRGCFVRHLFPWRELQLCFFRRGNLRSDGLCSVRADGADHLAAFARVLRGAVELVVDTACQCVSHVLSVLVDTYKYRLGSVDGDAEGGRPRHLIS